MKRPGKKCKHESADHMQVVVNGFAKVEWMQCLDCEAVFHLKKAVQQ